MRRVLQYYEDHSLLLYTRRYQQIRNFDVKEFEFPKQQMYNISSYNDIITISGKGQK